MYIIFRQEGVGFNQFIAVEEKVAGATPKIYTENIIRNEPPSGGSYPLTKGHFLGRDGNNSVITEKVNETGEIYVCFVPDSNVLRYATDGGYPTTSLGGSIFYKVFDPTNNYFVVLAGESTFSLQSGGTAFLLEPASNLYETVYTKDGYVYFNNMGYCPPLRMAGTPANDSKFVVITFANGALNLGTNLGITPTKIYRNESDNGLYFEQKPGWLQPPISSFIEAKPIAAYYGVQSGYVGWGPDLNCRFLYPYFLMWTRGYSENAKSFTSYKLAVYTDSVTTPSVVNVSAPFVPATGIPSSGFSSPTDQPPRLPFFKVVNKKFFVVVTSVATSGYSAYYSANGSTWTLLDHPFGFINRSWFFTVGFVSSSSGSKYVFLSSGTSDYTVSTLKARYMVTAPADLSSFSAIQDLSLSTNNLGAAVNSATLINLDDEAIGLTSTLATPIPPPVPYANPDTFEIANNGVYPVTTDLAVTDNDTGSRLYTVIEQALDPAYGTVVANGSGIKLTTKPGKLGGPTYFYYSLQDYMGTKSPNKAKVALTLICDVAMPAARNYQKSVEKNAQPVSIELLDPATGFSIKIGLYKDANGNLAPKKGYASIISQPFGSSLFKYYIVYRPFTDAIGVDRFTYSIVNARQFAATGTVTITIQDKIPGTALINEALNQVVIQGTVEHPASDKVGTVAVSELMDRVAVRGGTTPPNPYTGAIIGTLRLDTSEGPVAARKVYLYNYTTGAKLAETTSDGSTGAWSFTDLAPGDYFVVGVATESDVETSHRDFDALGVITVTE